MFISVNQCRIEVKDLRNGFAFQLLATTVIDFVCPHAFIPFLIESYFVAALAGPFVSFMPKFPIYVDRRTRHTIIYSSIGSGEYSSLKKSLQVTYHFA